ncbi:hypothetical protein RvY_09586 [Ramazzottius varieornatus]|uniref:Receptor ligand binding region domain-containing protein n=1 Tax=Ramazzottius varieornatus TaxID=947166 RepID=A0A1D1VFB3_RAMVA|nr:hypothetical protein RvY_09586 [Ramazzottius varieornatus]
MGNLLVFQIFLMGCGISLVFSAPERIPIGFVVKQGSPAILSAFRYAIRQHNSNNNPVGGFKLDERIDILETDDVLSVGRAVCAQMKKGIFAMMGLSRPGLYSTMQSYSQSFQMPYINLNFLPNHTGLDKSPINNLALSSNNFHLNLRPFHAPAVVDLVRHYGWKDLVYLYDSDEASYMMEFLVHEFSLQKRDVRVQRVSGAQEAYEYLKSIDSIVGANKKHIILDMPTASTQDLITKNLEDKALMKRQFHYLMINLGVEELNFDHLKFTGVNMTAFTLFNSNDDHYKQWSNEWSQLDEDAGWLGAGGPLTNEAALMVDAVHLWVASLNRLFKDRPHMFQNNFRRGELFNNGSRGLDCSKYPLEAWEHGKLLTHMLTTTRFTGLTGPVIFDAVGQRRNYTLNLVEMTFNRKVLVGTWSEKEGLLVTKRFTQVDVKPIPKDRNLVVTTIIVSPEHIHVAAGSV